ncbi:MAG: YraN family protein [Acidobacteria bacterium]|nr:YraN family protein [Acidobacteriota bacterium]
MDLPNGLLNLYEKDSSSPRAATRATGTKGEKLAAEFLESLGHRLVARNFTAPIGRNSKGVQVRGEIDLITLDGETICFIEVKTRGSEDLAGPLAAIDLQKQRIITRTALVYRRIFGVFEMSYRFDGLTVINRPNEPPQIEHFPGLWTEQRFKKKRWL